MCKRNILIVDDEVELLDLIGQKLENEGYNVSKYTSGEDALENINFKKPDLVLLDLMLPGISGLDTCKIIRRDPKLCDIPIIMLTARSHEIDIISGFEVGADDYITKPFNERILFARIKCALSREERKKINNGSIIKYKELLIDPERHEVSIKGEVVPMTSSELRVLYFLAQKPGIVFSRYQIIESIHKDDYLVNDRSIDVLLGRLRKKLGIYNK
jgi:two-component system, OmpR family, alkaline phosphatase synthesis response regulator PhoP